jgi:DNA-binding CsgD family transcriptional regulator
MADGKSAREISSILGLSHNTINSYIATALDVTGTCKATGLVAHCLRKGWIQ